MDGSSRTRFAILGMLAEGPRSGYDIKREVTERIAHFWNESIGNLYPVLQRLTRDGLVTRSADAKSPRARAVYRITAAGRRALEDWLHEPAIPTPPRLEILLKVYFGAHTEPAVLAAHILEYRAERERQLGMLQGVQHELRAAGPDPDVRYLRLTISAGIHAAQAAVAWCDEALADLGG